LLQPDTHGRTQRSWIGEMNLQHVNVKIFVDGALAVDPHRFIEVFHRWIAAQSMDEMLIDVADYRHVPMGPSVMLVGHEADYVMDNTGNRYGLVYNRKAPLEGSNEDRFLQAFRAAAKACSMLEAEVDGLRFSRREFALSINDRALAPNTDETLEACKVEIPAFLQNALGQSGFEVEYDTDPRHVFGAVFSLSTPFDLVLCHD
jgi:hypothetical protein